MGRVPISIKISIRIKREQHIFIDHHHHNHCLIHHRFPHHWDEHCSAHHHSRYCPRYIHWEIHKLQWIVSDDQNHLRLYLRSRLWLHLIDRAITVVVHLITDFRSSRINIGHCIITIKCVVCIPHTGLTTRNHNINISIAIKISIFVPQCSQIIIGYIVAIIVYSIANLGTPGYRSALVSSQSLPLATNRSRASQLSSDTSGSPKPSLSASR